MVSDSPEGARGSGSFQPVQEEWILYFFIQEPDCSTSVWYYHIGARSQVWYESQIVPVSEPVRSQF